MSTWTMHIPVLSTAHAPSMGHIVNLCDNHFAAADYCKEVMFVMINEDHDYEGDEAWVAPIAKWLDENYRDMWVRFDPDGDIEESLPTYEWE